MPPRPKDDGPASRGDRLRAGRAEGRRSACGSTPSTARWRRRGRRRAGAAAGSTGVRAAEGRVDRRGRRDAVGRAGRAGRSTCCSSRRSACEPRSEIAARIRGRAAIAPRRGGPRAPTCGVTRRRGRWTGPGSRVVAAARAAGLPSPVAERLHRRSATSTACARACRSRAGHRVLRPLGDPSRASSRSCTTSSRRPPTRWPRPARCSRAAAARPGRGRPPLDADGRFVDRRGGRGARRVLAPVDRRRPRRGRP